ncbi:MAG: NAD(P)/FAD-dependent oxidoreductase, partial [Spirochaetota bacterium]|nr:NAD(P)/FAD-dependent oxidoreductase [Spirochaetota bacterium]
GVGRCNLTNGCKTIKELADAYPRGRKELKSAFKVFNNNDVIEWFESRSVPLVVQDDNCVFPESQNSQSIIDCFFKASKNLGVSIKTGSGVKKIVQTNGKIELHFFKSEVEPISFDKVIVTTGGSQERKGLVWLEELNHKIEKPVPSLFTFNMPEESITGLMGIVVESVMLGIQGTKLKSKGPLLITHWGMSGPAVLKLSSFGARLLSDKGYDFNIQVNWVNEHNTELVRDQLILIASEHPNKLLFNFRPYNLPERLWSYLLEKSELPGSKKWNELGKKGINKLVSILSNDIYSVKGKTRFKEEFVTCGGVSLDSIDFNTMQSRVCKNLYFAGEVMDIDGITGGYNLQAAWTTAFIAGQLK